MILVTGGSGHLGANLVRRLLAEGEAVRALVLPGANNQGLDGLPVERVAGDVRDPESLARAMAGIERVYHCAARLSTVGGGEHGIFDVNVLGARNVLAAAREAGVRRVVVTGSFSAVGHRSDGLPSNEEQRFYPFEKHQMPYETTKVLVELECLRAVAEGLDVVIATSCAIIGPADYLPSRMGRTLVDFAAGRMRATIPGGFEFVAARDIVEGHLLAMAKGKTGRKYIFGTEYVEVDHLMEMMEQVTGRPRPRLRLPAPVMGAFSSVVSPILTRFAPDFPQRLTPAAVRLLTMRRRADTSRARSELGFCPSSIRGALEEAYADFVRRGVISPPGNAVRARSTTRSVTPATKTATVTIDPQGVDEAGTGAAERASIRVNA